MFKKLLDRIRGAKANATALPVALKRQRRIRESFDRTMEAITMAEAGAHDLAQEVILQAGQERPKILLVSKENSFTPPVMEYALQLAARVRCDLIALNVYTGLAHSKGWALPFVNLRFEEFENEALQGAEPFRQQAGQAGVTVSHVVKCGPLKKILAEVNREIKRINFVITAPEIKETEIPAFTGTPIFATSFVRK